MDQRVAHYRRVDPNQSRSVDNAILVCWDCYRGHRNPALEGFPAEEAVIVKVAGLTGWNESIVVAWLSEFAKRYALTAMNSHGFRRYWSWDRELPFRIVDVENGRIVRVKRARAGGTGQGVLGAEAVDPDCQAPAP